MSVFGWNPPGGGGGGFMPGPGQPGIPPFQPQPIPQPIVPSPGPGFDWRTFLGGVGCSIGKSMFCGHPVAQPIYENVCGSCGLIPDPIVDPPGDPWIPGPVDPFAPIPMPRPGRPGQPNGCAPGCGPTGCTVVTGVDRCGRPTTRKGTWKTDPRTGQPVCVPKKPRMNPMNAQANRRSMTRLKGAHREAKKIIDTLDKFAKPRRSRGAPHRRAHQSTCAAARGGTAACNC